VAARRAGAADGNASDRLSQRLIREAGRATAQRLPARLERDRLFRGQNVQVEYRWTEGQYERLPAMAAELIGLPVSLIVAQAPPAALAAKAATTIIPIVFVAEGASQSWRDQPVQVRPG